MQLDLTQDAQLKKVAESIEPWKRNQNWLEALTDLLSYVAEAGLETRKSRKFHQRIWEDNAVSSVGMGTVDISAAIEDAGFREWLAAASLEPLGDTLEAKISRLQTFYEEIVTRLKAFAPRTPHIKIFRVLAAFYPQCFTTITNMRMALVFHRALFGKRKKPTAVRRQVEITDRLNQVLRPCENSFEALAERMTLAWYLFTDYVQPDADDDPEVTDQTGKTELKPLPAVQRRKGLTSIGGGLATISNALSFVADGVSREELIDYLRTEFPSFRDNSIRTLINILKNEFYVIQEADGIFTPTDRGELFLESGDPQDLIPLFLTRNLGVDHVLCALADAPVSFPTR